MVSDYLRGLARKYLDMPVSEPGDALFTQIREECDKEGVSTREAFEFALRRPSPTPPVPVSGDLGTITFEVVMLWESPEGSWVELRVPGTADRFKISTDSDTFTKVLKPAIKSS